MKFESKFGIGEIVIYDPLRRKDVCGTDHDQLLEVQGVSFTMEGIHYFCRYPTTGVTAVFSEKQLEGDPLFDQEKGCYEETDA